MRNVPWFTAMIYAFDTLVSFVFQAEDGIRDWSVTGVQTCALPISRLSGELSGALRADGALPRPALSGHLDWSSPRLGDVELGGVGADLATAGGVLRADGRVAAAGQDRLRVRLALPWSPRADLARALESPETSLEVEGSQLELALLREF